MSPLGRRFLFAGDYAGDGRSDSTALVVVGVVDANAVGRSEQGMYVRVFAAVTESGPRPASSLLVRAERAGAAMIPAIRRAAADVAPDLPIVEATTLGARQRENQRSARQASGAAAAGGLLALLLSAIGLYAVVAFAVSQRTREIGIRTALGANRAQVVARFFAGGLRLALLGLAVGLPLSLVALRVFAATVDAAHMPTFMVAVIIATLVTAVAAFASWIPARRAAAVDPLIALRSE